MEPWQLLASLCMVHDSSCCNEQGPNKGFRVCKTKMDVTAKQLCSGDWPSAFRKFLEVCQALKYAEEPQYKACIDLFRPLIGASAPIDVQCAPVTPIPMKVSLPYLAG